MFSAFFNIFKWYNLRKIQCLKPEELKKLQEKKLRSLVKHAYAKVSYYRKLFDKAGLSPKDIRILNDLSKIPITSRTQLQALPRDEIITQDTDLSQCVNLRTGGSSGMPLDIFVSKEELRLRYLYSLLLYIENGYRITDKIFYMVHPRYLDSLKRKRLFQYLSIMRVKYVSIFDSPEDWLEELIKFRPNVIKGHTSSIKELGLEIKKREIKDIYPKLLLSMGEFLNRKDRDFINSVFQTELIDLYGTSEWGVIAWECSKHKGYHIQSGNVIVEFIKSDGTKALDGEEGEIVITILNSFTMPFIRYKLGDRAIPSSKTCPCGRTLPLMEFVSGRVYDSIILPNGKTVSPYALTYASRNPGIAQFQIVQSEINKIRINIVKNKDFSFKTIMTLKKNYKEILGDDIEIEPFVVDRIHKDKIGEFRVVVSEISRSRY